MKTRSTFRIFSRLLIAVMAVTFAGCDFYQPQKSFRFAVPKDDYMYTSMFGHLKSILEQNGYEVTAVYTDRDVEANRLVAQGKADLAFINNVSSHIVEELGQDSERLRTVLPLSERALLGFSRKASSGPQSVHEVFENKTLGVEILNGEGHGNIAEMLSRAHVENVKFVQSDQGTYDVRIFWGSLYGRRALTMLDSGWHAISFDPAWIDFQTMSDPALEAVTLPAMPGDLHSQTVHSVATTAVLVVNKDVGENAVYQLTEAVLQGKLGLVRQDPMYHSITEAIRLGTLLYPLHEGASSYLRRDTPSFLERYADSLALVISLIALLYGFVQAAKNYMKQLKKDRIDAYFLEFLDIRSKGDLSAGQQINRLNDLLQRALVQMTNEKMDKGDFHIFARLIQQELTNLGLRAQ